MTPPSIPPPPTEEELRVFLDLFAPAKRSHVANAFLRPVRLGMTNPNAIVFAVQGDLQRKLGYASNRHRERDADFLHKVKAHPQEARLLARWAVLWEALPDDEKSRRKAQRAVEGINIWAESQPPSDAQLALLLKLGHTERPASKAEASRLIDTLLHKQNHQPDKQRPQPKTAFGAEVLDRAGLGDRGGRE